MFNRPARKRFGQHFLEDSAVISAIIQDLMLKNTDTVVEIGPGRGALTLPLLRHLNQLIAIELDKDVVAAWRAQIHPNLILIESDALQVDYTQWGKDIRLVGNLPYNISTPLLIHLLDALPVIQDMHFMLQKEVVDRLAANPGTKDYGRLTVMIQACCEVEWLFDVPPEAFNPPPKVQSAVVRLVPLANPINAEERVILSRLLLQAFGMRRKTIANNLKQVMPLDTLTDLGIELTLRPEVLTVAQYIQLARSYPPNNPPYHGE